jgi:hypothetical protein
MHISKQVVHGKTKPKNPVIVLSNLVAFSSWILRLDFGQENAI